jgi:hypothetical protein
MNGVIGREERKRERKRRENKAILNEGRLMMDDER